MHDIYLIKHNLIYLTIFLYDASVDNLAKYKIALF